MLFWDSSSKKKKKKEEERQKQREEVLSNIKEGDLSQLKDYGYDKEIVLEAISHSTEDISSDIALFLQNGDKDVALALIDRGWIKSWDCYSEQLQTDPMFLNAYIKKGGNVKDVRIGVEFFLNDRELALLSFQLPNLLSQTRRQIIEKYNDDYQIGLEGVQYCGEYFELLSDRLQHEYGIIKMAIKKRPLIILKLDKIWMRDNRIVEALLRSILEKMEEDPNYSLEDAISILLFIGNSAQTPEIHELKREVALHIISRSPNSLSRFDESVQNDPQVLMTYLQYGGKVDSAILPLLKIGTLNANKGLALEFIRKAGKYIFEDLDVVLQNHLQIAREAVKKDPLCIQCVTNKETLKTLLKEIPTLRQFIDPQIFKEIAGEIYQDEKEILKKESDENNIIVKKQQKELDELRSVLENELIYQEKRSELEEQSRVIEEQQREIDALKRQLALLRGEPIINLNLEKGVKKDEDNGKQK